MATVSIAVTAVNDAPVATDQAVVTEEDTATAIALSATDVEGSPLTYAIVSGPAHGTVSGTAPTLTYTPAANYNGAETITFKANDGTADSNVATVAITVTPVNDAPVAVDDVVTTPEDTAVTGSVLANDTDVDAGTTLTASLVASPTHGTVTLSPTGVFTYTPAANVNGPDSFTYKANDGIVDSNVATVTITVTAVNDAPIAVDDGATTPEDTPVTIAVRANDTDLDGDPLLLIAASGPAHGTAAITPDGTVTYTPAANYSGADTFTYTISDGQGGAATGTVTVAVTAVNDAPVAVADHYSTNEDTAATVAAPGVLANDTDVDQDAVTAVLLGGPAHGALGLNADGSFTYTPAANFNGSDSFTYQATDGTAASNVGTVTITVNAVNDLPVAVADDYATAEDEALTVAAPGVLGNDTDVEGGTLTAVLATGPAHGTLTLHADGSFGYTPAANFNGTDSFTYTGNDGSADSSPATVTITIAAVNDVPLAINDAYTTNEDGLLAIAAAGVLANDTDVEHTALTAVLVGGPAHGTFELTADGSFTYAPAANFNGTDSFTYQVTDGTAESNVATVTLTVNAVNDAPVAAVDSYATTEDTALTIGAPGVLANDTDVDSAALTADLVSEPAHGTLSLNADGSFTYTPAANFSGSDSFSYRANDGGTPSTVATVTIMVSAVNDAPVAVDDTATTAEDTPALLAVLTNDTDADGDTLSVTAVQRARARQRRDQPRRDHHLFARGQLRRARHVYLHNR